MSRKDRKHSKFRKEMDGWHAKLPRDVRRNIAKSAKLRGISQVRFIENLFEKPIPVGR